MNEQVLTRVREIASDILQSEVSSDSSPDTVPAWDSVQHLNLMLAVEEEFHFQFLPEEMDQARSISAIAQLVSARSGA